MTDRSCSPPQVMDVAQKFGSGTGSLGLDRYYILLKGDEHYPRILDMKQVVTGVLEKYLGLRYTDEESMMRVRLNVKATEPFSNLYAGTATYNGYAFFINEKNRFKSSVDINGLTPLEFRSYSFVAGHAQAMLHIKASCNSPDCPLHEPVLHRAPPTASPRARDPGVRGRWTGLGYGRWGLGLW